MGCTLPSYNKLIIKPKNRKLLPNEISPNPN